MSQVKFCPKCGTERLARFCSKCGFNFDEVAAEVQPAAVAPVATPEPVIVTPPPRKPKTLGKLNRSGVVNRQKVKPRQSGACSAKRCARWNNYRNLR